MEELEDEPLDPAVAALLTLIVTLTVTGCDGPLELEEACLDLLGGGEGGGAFAFALFCRAFAAAFARRFGHPQWGQPRRAISAQAWLPSTAHHRRTGS